MAAHFALPDSAVPAIEKYAELGFVMGRDEFTRQLITPEEPILEIQDLVGGFDPLKGSPVLESVPRQANEAVDIIVDDMSQHFKGGDYVLRVLFRQGDALLSLDKKFGNFHRDLEGNCLATYMVSDSDPTIARVDGKTRSGEPFQVVRLRGDVPHRRPTHVPKDRTTVVANISDRQMFERTGGGNFSLGLRLEGVIQTARYR